MARVNQGVFRKRKEPRQHRRLIATVTDVPVAARSTTAYALALTQDTGANAAVTAAVTLSLTEKAQSARATTAYTLSLTKRLTPPGTNPQQGDPAGHIHFAHFRIGSTSYFASEALIRDDPATYGGKKAATLLKISAFERALSREGYRASTFKVEVSDTPDASGDRQWRGFMTAATLEAIKVEVYRCQAPYGRIVGVPFRLMSGVVRPGGFKATSGFRFEFDCVDVLGDMFADPLKQPQIPPHPLTLSEFPGMDEDYDGKVAPRVLGNMVETGIGAVKPVFMGQVNLSVAPFSGAAVLVDVYLISEGYVSDVVDGYYNPPIWGAAAVVEAGDLIRPTPANQNGHVFRANNAGTTGASEPTWPTTGTVGDNGITWAEAGADDPSLRYVIPDSAWGTVIVAPHKPGWTTATGLATQYVDYPNASGRRYTPAFVLASHRYAQAIREGRISLTFDVVGATALPGGGPAILDMEYLYIHLLLNYLFYETNGITYGTMPQMPGLDGNYSIIDTNSADAAKVVADAEGGYIGGFLLGDDGEQEGIWEVLSRLLRGGALEVGQNRHGQLMFARRDVAATPVITFRAQRDIMSSSYTADGSRRATGIRYRWGYRYHNPYAPFSTPKPGDPLTVGDTSRPFYGEWESGLNILDSNPAGAALAANGKALQRIEFDNYVTRDAATALAVATRELNYATGPGPAYHGTLLFELVGPWDLLSRLDINGKTRELNDVIEVYDDEGPTANGTDAFTGRITRIRLDPEANTVTLAGEILP